MDAPVKVRENRLRRMARRRGLVLRKSRTRDPGALSYGEWWVVDESRNFLVQDKLWDLDQVEQWLNDYSVAR
jgi:hypothetical protein